MESKIRKIPRPVGSSHRAFAPRSARLPRLIGAPADSDSRLSTLKIVVAGCGSVGSNIALHLSRLRIARLLLVDKGRLKPESLLTHPVHPEAISRRKASSLGRLCKGISPTTEVEVFDGAVEALGLVDFDGFDRIVLATDNLHAEVEVNQRCLWLGLPLTQVSVHGDTLVSQVRSYTFRGTDSPCLVCAYSPAEWSALNSESQFSCQDAWGTSTTKGIKGAPTMSVSFLCSMAADLALIHILRQELTLGSPDSDSMLEFCGFNYRSVISPLARDPDCVCDHSRLRRVMGPDSLSHASLQRLAEMAGYGEKKDIECISFHLEGMVYCERGACLCDQGYLLKRFYPTENGSLRCHRCGKRVRPQPFYTHDPVPAAIVADEFDRPIGDLGAGSVRYAVVRGTRGSVLISTGGMERMEP